MKKNLRLDLHGGKKKFSRKRTRLSLSIQITFLFVFQTFFFNSINLHETHLHHHQINYYKFIKYSKKKIVKLQQKNHKLHHQHLKFD